MPTGLTEKIGAWQSKGLSNEKVMPPTTSNNSLSPKRKWNNSKIRVEFKGCCLEQHKITFTLNNVANLFIVYELDEWSQNLNADITLKYCLFGAVKLSNNVDPYKYSEYGTGFNSYSLFFSSKFWLG